MSTSDEDAAMEAGASGIFDADPQMAALFEMLNGAKDVNPMALLMSQFQDQIQTDPRTAQIFHFLEQQRRQQAEKAAVNEQEFATPPDVGDGPSATTKANEEAQVFLEDLYTELEVLRVRNDILAAALGACHLCFGADPRCEECGGRGAAGSRAPEPAAFRKYVIPAVRRARHADAARESNSEPSRPPETERGTVGAGRE